jgi:ribosomal-protein-alanine N-acetyltransferase
MSGMKKQILLVGYTDTSLMPLCAAVLNCMFAQKNWQDITVSSCGFWAVDGHGADPLMITAAGEMGLNLSSHGARSVKEELLQSATLVIPQDAMVLRGVKELLKSSNQKIGKITKLSPPKENTLEAYRESRQEVVAFCNRLLRKIADQMRQQGEEVVIRPITEKDVEQVAFLEQQCFSHPWSQEGVLAELEKENGCFVGAFYENRLVAYGSLVLTCGVGYINNIAVEKDHRQKGIGDALLTALEEFCVNQKAESITLEVRQSNTVAIGLYEKHDYLSVGLRRNFYRDPTEDGVIMTKTF